MSRMTSRTLGLLIFVALLSPHRPAYAQGVTTGAITGVILAVSCMYLAGTVIYAVANVDTSREALAQVASDGAGEVAREGGNVVAQDGATNDVPAGRAQSHA